MQFEQITGAECWASYFINGDASGLSDEERAWADAWIERNHVLNVVDCSEEGRFTWHYDLYTGAPFRGGSVVDYTCELKD